MPTQCSTDSFLFQTDSGRDVSASFDGGHVTADGGALLLAEAERTTGILRQLAGCVTDHRDPDLIEHTAYQLLARGRRGLGRLDDVGGRRLGGGRGVLARG